MVALPKHFSLMSAQTGPDHDDASHKALISDLKSHGFKVTETNGMYGYKERSMMVEHSGKPEELSAIDSLARKYKQHSVLHSSFKLSKNKKGVHHNELRYSDGSPSVFGKGYRLAPEANDLYTEHPTIGKFQMHLDFPEENKTKKAIPVSGSISGQTAAAGPSPKTAPAAMPIQAKISNPPRQKFIKAPIVSSKTPAVNPKSIQSPAKIPSSKPRFTVSSNNVAKAMMHQDGETMVDSRSHASAAGPMPQIMMDWGSKYLVPMKINDVKHLKVGGYVIKVTKKSPDLYAGWVENDANIGHKFERLTMPQLLLQLRSALELYGREQEMLGTEILHSDHAEEEKQEKKKELTDVGQAISDALEETKDASEADKQAKIREKLEALRSKVKEEVIPAKDLAEGLEQPEEECPACESESEECSCYEGLSRPRLEFDGKKVTIFFKSDWGAEDKDNFKDDLKRRAGIILKKREEARSNALEKAKKLIYTMRKNKK